MQMWIIRLCAGADPNPNPPEADGNVIVGPQLAVCLRASVLGKPWSRGGTTGATPSTTVGATPSTTTGVLASTPSTTVGATPSTTTGVLASTRSTGCYFSSELLSNTAIFFS
jgi:hypothetical protein